MADLACPKCSDNLPAPQEPELPLRACRGCAGAWVDATGLQAAGLDLALLRKVVAKSSAPTEFGCPACARQILVEVKLADCALDVCPACEGVFFDLGERETVQAASSDQGGKTEKARAAGKFIVGELILEGICSLISKAGDALG